MDKAIPDYKGMCERQEKQIEELKCVCEVQEKKLCEYERKVNKLKKKNKKLKKQIEGTKKSCYELIKLLLSNSTVRIPLSNGIFDNPIIGENKKRCIK